MSNTNDLKEVTDIELEAAKKKLEELSSGKWSILQIFLQEIQANDLITEVMENKKSAVPITKQIETLKQRIEYEFKEDPALLALIIETFPHYNTIRRWTKGKGWQDAVYDKMEYAHLFDNKNKAKVVKGIFDKATASGREDMRASELYFKIYHKVFVKGDDKREKDALQDLQNVVLGKKG